MAGRSPLVVNRRRSLQEAMSRRSRRVLNQASSFRNAVRADHADQYACAPNTGSFSRIAHAPERAGSIIRNQKRSIGSGCYSHWPPPNLAVRSEKAGQKVLVDAVRFPIPEGHAHYFVTRTHQPVPRAVFAREDIA